MHGNVDRLMSVYTRSVGGGEDATFAKFVINLVCPGNKTINDKGRNPHKQRWMLSQLETIKLEKHKNNEQSTSWYSLQNALR